MGTGTHLSSAMDLQSRVQLSHSPAWTHRSPAGDVFWGDAGDQPWVSMSSYGSFSSVIFVVNEANLLKPTTLLFYINIYILSRQKNSFLVSSVLH